MTFVATRHRSGVPCHGCDGDGCVGEDAYQFLDGVLLHDKPTCHHGLARRRLRANRQIFDVRRDLRELNQGHAADVQDRYRAVHEGLSHMVWVDEIVRRRCFHGWLPCRAVLPADVAPNGADGGHRALQNLCACNIRKYLINNSFFPFFCYNACYKIAFGGEQKNERKKSDT